MEKLPPVCDGGRNTGSDRSVPEGWENRRGMGREDVRCFHSNKNVRDRPARGVPRLLKQKLFLTGTFNKDEIIRDLKQFKSPSGWAELKTFFSGTTDFR